MLLNRQRSTSLVGLRDREGMGTYKFNEQKEAMPNAAFQFGLKMQDDRKPL